ncbi:MAG TPA: asparagine synthase (glutamine-hydrolyzing) [Pseudomonadota bacterium]|nr:asparagine synthase (glutamine-hydrolyzing) [Pseudomonadota bacterium]HNN49687.1 asparagine synthase (glutamine-hydrolyzing) [Pseudomonadota bacterium]
MCGIVGAVDLQGRRNFDPQRLADMAASVRHRGPDDAFAYLAPGIAMATQRLAIQDVAAGRQPLTDPRGQIVVSQNGELLNADSLRSELARQGHSFRSHCDTEVWPALYLSAKTDAFVRAQGQFAVALWDRPDRTLYLARDRVGICPLYYTVAQGYLLWASEIKALLASGLVNPEVDREGIDLVFTLFAAGTKRTAFRNICSLWPGHYLRVRSGDIATIRYWDLDFPPQGEERKDRTERLTDELTQIVDSAVSRRFASDGPVATYLSGGLDSSLVLATASRLRPLQPLHSFTVGFDGAGPDERPQTQQTAALLSAKLHTLVPSARDILDALPSVVLAAEGPFMDTANACLLLLAKQVAAAGFKVVLTGEGADEAMGGYVWHKTAKLFRWLSKLHPGLPSWIRRSVAEYAMQGTPQATWGNRFGNPQPSLFDVYEPLSRARSLLYSDAMTAAVSAHDPFADLDISVDHMRAWHPLNQSLYLEYKLMLPGHLLLGKGDRVAMQSGVEARYPFLDESFVAFCSQLAPEYKLCGFTEKWLLRRVAQRVLPANMRQPQKSMFKANSLCLLKPQPAWIDQLLLPESLRKTGYFSVEKVAHERALQAQLPDFHPRRYLVDGSFTAVVMTQLWHHLFLGGGLCELAPFRVSESSPLPFFSDAGNEHAN